VWREREIEVERESGGLGRRRTRKAADSEGGGLGRRQTRKAADSEGGGVGRRRGSGISSRKRLLKGPRGSGISSRKRLLKGPRGSGISSRKRLLKDHRGSGISSRKRLLKDHRGSGISSRKRLLKDHRGNGISSRKQLLKDHRGSGCWRITEEGRRVIAEEVVRKERTSGRVVASSRNRGKGGLATVETSAPCKRLFRELVFRWGDVAQYVRFDEWVLKKTWVAQKTFNS
jgi:hypothetical protein